MINGIKYREGSGILMGFFFWDIFPSMGLYNQWLSVKSSNIPCPLRVRHLTVVRAGVSITLWYRRQLALQQRAVPANAKPG